MSKGMVFISVVDPETGVEIPHYRLISWKTHFRFDHGIMVMGSVYS